jgi:O-antigen/teichoic acid export membrane protein
LALSLNFSATFKQHLSNTSWLLFEKISRIFVLSLVGILVARYLQPGNYGLLNYAISLVGLLGTLASLGMDNVLIRDVVRKKEQEETILGTGLALRLIGTLLLNLVLVLIALREEHSTGVLIIIVGISTIFQSFKIIDLFFYSRIQAKYSVLVQLAQMLISSLLKLVLIYNHAPLIYFALLIVFDNIFIAIALILLYSKYGDNIFNWNIDISMAKYLLKESWPLMIANIMISINMRADQILLKHMLNTTALGQYVAAVKLSEMWYFIPIAIVNSIYPTLIKAKKSEETRYKVRFQQLYFILFWLMFAISTLITLFSKPIVNFLYGKTYLPAAPALSILIWTSVFVAFNLVSSKWLLIENLQKYFTINKFAGAVVNIVLNLVLIPRFGILGSAMTTIISYAVANLFLFIIIGKLRNHLLLMIKSIFVFPDLQNLTKSS